MRTRLPLRLHCSMQQSVLLCISTILDSGNHYSKMMELMDDYGNLVFETIKITLVCDDCLKTDRAPPPSPPSPPCN